ncbi:MAG TPA: type VI secretion protein IcmF/TssM N-terminal domain-containing protein, partial [Myxococcota bacterium]|nr:type VI secretion protein IcmF/TssM N-terminal domain-containing protein [Myxococcota bacterium]
MPAWLADTRVRIAALAAGGVAIVALALGALTRNWLVALLIALTALLAVLVGLLVRVLIRREREDALQLGVGQAAGARGAAGPAGASGGVQSPEERFAGELGEVRAQLGSRSALYELPWFLLLGESGGGKSALLAASGLEFPVQGSRRGFEATRFAEVVLANEAVALDTSGRFFRGGERDREEWLRLLARVRQARPDCALDAVVVVLPVSSLLRRTGDTDEEARELRRRLNEIRVELGVDPPVYLVLAKADQLEGFAETVRVLPAAWREQVVGWTNDQRRLADPEARVAEAWAAFAARLDAFLPELLLREPEPARQRRIFVFPDQIAALGRAAARFAGVAFRRDAYSEAAPFLRGVYLACAKSPEAAGESVFLRDFFLDVVRGDAGLALAESRIGPTGRRALLGAGLLAAAWLLAVWGVSFAQNYQGTHELARRTERALSADPSLRDLGDLWTSLADAAHDARSAISVLGFNELGRAVDRGERAYTFAFERSFDRLTKRNLEAGLA